MFVTEFSEKPIRESVICRRIKLCMEQIVRFRNDSSVQPILFIVKLNHSLINRNVIRASTSLRL